MKRALVLFSLLFGVCSSMFAQLNSVVVTGKNGTEVSISELKNGKNPYIIFFHGKGGPSIKLLYAFMDVYEQWNKETGLKLFVISIDNYRNISIEDDIEDYNESNETQIDFYYDEKLVIQHNQLITAYPYFLLYDGYGNAVYSKCGFNPTEGFEPQLLSILNSFKSYYLNSNGLSDNLSSSDSSKEVIRVEDYGDVERIQRYMESSARCWGDSIRPVSD